MAITATTVTAAVASSTSANRAAPSNRPPPLQLDDPSQPQSTYRQSLPRQDSRDSVESDDSPQSPGLSALDSSAALILVHDNPEDMNVDYEFSDDEGLDDDDDIVSPIFEIRRTSIPPLSPLSIFLYLLAPFLKLGALSIIRSSGSLPLKHGLPSLFAFAAMTAFSRQLWYMLARYLRKAELMEMLCDTFAKARGKEGQRQVIRSATKAGIGLISGLLVFIYVHESVAAIIHYFPPSILVRVVFGLAIGVFIFYLSTSKSLASKKVIITSWLSVLAYIAWLSCAVYAHTKGLLVSEAHGEVSPWQGVFTIAFAFCTSSTLPLYASLKSGSNVVTTAKTPRSRSFRLLSVISITCATLLILPIVIFAGNPNVPATLSPPTPTPEAVQIALSVLSSITLLLGVPQAMLTIPPLPIPLRIARSANFNVGRTLLSVILITTSLAFSFVDASFVEYIFRPVTVLAITIALASTYFVPVFLHICVHLFKRPLSIAIPRTPLVNTSSPSTPHGTTLQPHSRAVHDELLQRKERALQKKQFRKRIVWDIGSWLQLGACVLGAGIGALLLFR